ncbi:MAG: hypothetical protein E6I22_00010 [Chloroflexi bacterium]|nr:MAG: hypothetical protein E6I22_00010 [Chloroflexota bacterium]
MGESVTEGTVSKWLKQVGEPVRQGEGLVEVTTDKVDAEIPAPANGTLSKILADAGKTIARRTASRYRQPPTPALPHRGRKIVVSPALPRRERVIAKSPALALRGRGIETSPPLPPRQRQK